MLNHQKNAHYFNLRLFTIKKFKKAFESIAESLEKQISRNQNLFKVIDNVL